MSLNKIFDKYFIRKSHSSIDWCFNTSPVMSRSGDSPQFHSRTLVPSEQKCKPT
ncbi:hypothetical protein Hanom_Chr11g01047651 [Helianthus anomalus]